jgi:hypothetical protein
MASRAEVEGSRRVPGGRIKSHVMAASCSVPSLPRGIVDRREFLIEFLR